VNGCCGDPDYETTIARERAARYRVDSRDGAFVVVDHAGRPVGKPYDTAAEAQYRAERMNSSEQEMTRG